MEQHVLSHIVERAMTLVFQSTSVKQSSVDIFIHVLQFRASCIEKVFIVKLILVSSAMLVDDPRPTVRIWHCYLLCQPPSSKSLMVFDRTSNSERKFFCKQFVLSLPSPLRVWRLPAVQFRGGEGEWYLLLLWGPDPSCMDLVVFTTSSADPTAA